MREPYGYEYINVGELFKVRAGGRVTRKNQIEGDIPYVTAVTTNNGIENFISNPIFTQEDILTVNFFGNVFYHPYKVAYKDGTYGLESKSKLTKNQKLYIGSSIQKQTLQMGDYNNAIRVKDLRELEVYLPITPEGTPDYEYMEDYITYIKGEYVDKLEESHREEYRQLEALGLDEGAIELEEPYGYKEVTLGEMFKVTGTNSTNAGNLVFSEEGINFVGRTAIDNGVQGKVEELEYEPNEGNTITISQVGTMVANYQEEPYYTSQNIAKVYTEELTKRQNLYITSVINKHLIRYEGYVTPKLIDIKGFDFKLPITPEGTPDYEYMENYIKHIAYTYRMNRRDEQEEEIRQLRKLI